MHQLTLQRKIPSKKQLEEQAFIYYSSIFHIILFLLVYLFLILFIVPPPSKTFCLIVPCLFVLFHIFKKIINLINNLINFILYPLFYQTKYFDIPSDTKKVFYSFTKKETILAIIRNDCTDIYNVERESLIFKIKYSPFKIKFSHKNKLILTEEVTKKYTDTDASPIILKIWNVKTKEIIFEQQTGNYTFLCFSPDEKYLLICTSECFTTREYDEGSWVSSRTEYSFEVWEIDSGNLICRCSDIFTSGSKLSIEDLKIKLSDLFKSNSFLEQHKKLKQDMYSYLLSPVDIYKDPYKILMIFPSDEVKKYDCVEKAIGIKVKKVPLNH